MQIIHLLLIFILAISTNIAYAQKDNKPPQVEPIRGILNPPTTTYTVKAIDPEGKPLKYEWQMQLECGTYKISNSPTASWTHPEGPPPTGCPHEDGTSHVGTITVYVSDDASTVTCYYEGSETGVGSSCVVDERRNPNSPTVVSSVDSNSNFLLFGLLIILAISIVAYYFYPRKAKRRCEQEYIDEQTARAELERATREFENLQALKSNAEKAQNLADTAAQNAETAVRQAGKKWTASGSTDFEGKHIELQREGYQDKTKGAKAEEALRQASEAKRALDDARSTYDNAGGESTLSRLRDAMQKAKSALEKASSALKACLLIPEATSSDASTSNGNTVATSGKQPEPTVTQNPPAASTPQPKEPTGLVCNPGERRNSKTTSITVTLLDLESIILKQDKIYSDAGNEAMKFVDYLQDLKDLLSLGKKIKGGVSGYLDGSLTGTADAVGLPDFLTWYDVGIDELTKSMHKLFGIMKEKQKLGDYWLEYKTKQVTLTCTQSEVCANNSWIKECALTVTDLGTQNHSTSPISVHLIQELNPAITRLFRQLRSRYEADKTKAQQFTKSCTCN